MAKDKKSKKKKKRIAKEHKPDKEMYPKSPQKFSPIKVMPQISENTELTQEQISDHEVEAAVWPKVFNSTVPLKMFIRAVSDTVFDMTI